MSGPLSKSNVGPITDGRPDDELRKESINRAAVLHPGLQITFTYEEAPLGAAVMLDQCDPAGSYEMNHRGVSDSDGTQPGVGSPA